MVVYGLNPVQAALEAGRVSRIRIGPRGSPPSMPPARGALRASFRP